MPESDGPRDVRCPVCGLRMRLVRTEPSAVYDCTGCRARVDLAPQTQGALLGRYEMRDRLGEGGAAVVYRAWDRQLRRPVAVKLLRDKGPANEGMRRRFEREAQAMAGLAHPNIVGVYDVGEADGQMFIVMELVDGQTFQRLLAGRRSELRSLLRILERAARGLAAAHEKGIVHRDVKPSNILVAEGGAAKVADFGLAHLANSQSGLTRTGSSVGTPLYMAPEQVRGDVPLVGPATDVYALGAILYEILTGRPPHLGTAVAELYTKILSEEPLRPRRINPRAPAGLEAVCLKALEKHPAGRYPTAGEFADDLARWLVGEPVSARPPSAAERVRRFVRRHRAVAGAAAAAVVLAVAFAATILSTAVGRSKRVREGLARAAGLEQEGRLAEARDAYTAALALDERSADARAGLERIDRRLVELASERKSRAAEAMTLLEAGRPALDEAFRYLYKPEARYEELVERVDRGQKLIELGIEKAPELALGHYLLGRAWDIKGWPERAEASWRKALELDPLFGPAHYQLGRLCLTRAFLSRLGRTMEDRTERVPESERWAQEAIRSFDAALAAGSGFDDEMQRALAAAMVAFSRWQRTQCAELARDGLARFGGREGAEEFLWLEGLTQESAQAIRTFSRALDVRPRHALALFCRGSLRAETDPRGGIEDLSRAIDLSPRFAEAYVNRGRAYRVCREPRSALEDYDRAAALQPNWAHPYINRGNVRLDLRDFDGAIQDLDRAIQLDPRLAEPFNSRGRARASKGDLPGALADFDRAIEIDPAYVNALIARVAARRQTGDVEGATADCSRLIELRPRMPEAYANRAGLRADKGDLGGAAADLEKALELTPPDGPHRASIEAAIEKLRRWRP